MAMVGEKAPEWTASAYFQGKKISIGSQDFENQWYVMYWWPFDYAGICNSEIHGFQMLYERFKSINVHLVGISCDSYFVHEQWFKSASFSNINRPTHPIVADNTHELSTLFGVYNDSLGCSFRATMLIAPDTEIKSMSVNHLSVARDPRDILVTAQAFVSGKACSLPTRQKIQGF